MNFFKKILYLIVSPADGWNDIKKFNVPRTIFATKVFYPLIGIVAISVFVQFFYTASGTLTEYLQRSIIECSRFFFGYTLSGFILTSKYVVDKSDELFDNKVHIFTLYLYSILIILGVINNLLPVRFPFIDFFQLYLIFIIYKGVNFLGIDNKKEWEFTIIASLAIILPSYLIKILLEFILL